MQWTHYFLLFHCLMVNLISDRSVTFMPASWLWPSVLMLLDRSQECSTERSVRIRIAESSGKMSPVTRPGGRQLFLFPPGSGSGGSWIKLCWGCYNERGEEGDTQVSNEAWEMSAAVIPNLCNGQRRLILVTFIVSPPVHILAAATPRPWRPWVPCITLPWVSSRCCLLSLSHSWHHIALELITMLLAPDLTSLINSPWHLINSRHPKSAFSACIAS